MSTAKRLLIVAAHPDDEVLGAGGTIAKRAREGWDMAVIFCASGVKGRLATKQAEHNPRVKTELKQLELDSQKAADLLGIRRIYRLGFPDNRMDTVSRMDVSHAIRKVVEKERPQVVITHHAGDYNWDHTIVFQSVLMACRPNVGDFFPQQIFSFEVLSSTERAHQKASTVFAPNHYVPLHEKDLALKTKALLAYRSEIRPYPHPRSAQAVENLAAKRGNEVGLAYAECFELIRGIER